MSSRKRISQSYLPITSLKEALKIPRAIEERFAGQPTTPLDVATAVGRKPTSSGWRALTGSAVGYGLTDGGYGASRIALTELGKRAVAPRREGEDEAALREACLKPTAISGFLNKYDGHKLPRKDIALNVLKAEFDLPVERANRAMEIILENAEFIGVIREIKGDKYVTLVSAVSPGSAPAEFPSQSIDADTSARVRDSSADSQPSRAEASPDGEKRPVKAVFVGHSSGTRVFEQVRQLLELADLRAEIATEQETAAIPVPDKVFDAMSRSDAAIICVTADPGQEGRNGFVVNPNLLIEIGAAYVRHDRRLVLLWDQRVAVPSNLQGLYRCEFKGDELSLEAGMKLQRALIEIKQGRAPV